MFTSPNPATNPSKSTRKIHRISTIRTPSPAANAPRVGTAGWAYPHWNGLVYPKTSGSGFHALELIARHLDCVEINSSFYQEIKPEVTQLWMRKVAANPQFQFTAKLHQRFTHGRELAEEPAKQFKQGLFPMLRAGKLGALLLQFPWSFRFTEENRDFLIRLRRNFHEFPLVAEMRHSSWLADEAVGTLLDYRIGFCNIDQPGHTSAMPPTGILTSNVGYVRLHGRNPANSLASLEGNSLPGAAEPQTRLRQHDYLYQTEDLAEWSPRIQHINKFSDRTFVVFNNDARGKSFVNALQAQALLQTGLGRRRPPAPLTLRRKYPIELEHFGPARFEQQSLFSEQLSAASSAA